MSTIESFMAVPPASPEVRTRTRPRLRPGLVIAGLVVAVALVAALVPGLLASGKPNDAVLGSALKPPSGGRWFGTDELGRDIYTRVIHGTRLTLALGVGAIAISVVGGVVLGLLAGYAGRAVGSTVMRVVDIMLAFPGLLLALLVVALAGRGTVNIAIALGVGAMPGYARVLRSGVLSVRKSGYVEAATALGRRPLHIVVRHVLPNSVGPLLLLAALDFGIMILAASSLSFLGLGPQPPTPEWAQMISESRNFVQRGWWIAVFPGAALTAVVVSVNVLSHALQTRVARTAQR